MTELIYNDKSLMPYGKFKGKALANVPSSYLLWLWQTSEKGTRMYDKKLAKYIEDNLKGLELEAIAEKQRQHYAKR